MKNCNNCNARIDDGVMYCTSCGMKITSSTDNQNINTGVKDNTTLAFVLSIIGGLCCTYVAIPGLILSIISLKNMNEGKIKSDKKWMAIVGIILSSIGIINLIYNLVNPNQNKEIVDQIMKQFNLQYE